MNKGPIKTNYAGWRKHYMQVEELLVSAGFGCINKSEEPLQRDIALGRIQEFLGLACNSHDSCNSMFAGLNFLIGLYSNGIRDKDLALRLENAGNYEKIIAYGSGKVKKELATSRFLIANRLEMGLIRVYFPELFECQELLRILACED